MVRPKYSFPIKSPTMSDKTKNDVKRLRSFAADIETPDDMPHVTNKLPPDFYEFTCKCHELQLHKHW